MQNNTKFAELRYSKRIWAIGSIHSHLESFESIKKHILNNFSNGDRLVFLGNIIGLGNYPKETLTSAINLRNILLSKFESRAEATTSGLNNIPLPPPKGVSSTELCLSVA